MCDIELNEVKLNLKQWELGFLKENGRKATKNDISNNKTIEEMYLKYARLKKDVGVEDKCKEKRIKHYGVWGSNLLKSNSNIQTFEAVKKIDSSIPKNPSTTETNEDFLSIKKTIGLVSSKKIPFTLKKEKLSTDKLPFVGVKTDCVVANISALPSEPLKENSSQNSTVTDLKSCEKLVSDGEKHQFKIANKTSIQFNKSSHQIKNCLHKNAIQRNNASSFLRRPVPESWFKENAITENSNLNQEKDNQNLSSFSNPNSFSNSSIEANTSKLASETNKTEVTHVNTDIQKDLFQESASHSFSKSTDNVVDKESTAYCKPVESPVTTQAKAANKPTTAARSVRSSTGRSSLVSNNFVRINIQKKVYLRKSGRGNSLRKKVYLEKLAKKGFVKRRWSKNNGNTFHASQNDNKCFKCGQQGHWANKCTNKAFRTSAKSNLSKFDEESNISESISDILTQHQLNSISTDESVVQNCQILRQTEPLYTNQSYNQDEVNEVLKKFGFSQFRSGQARAIRRILCGSPTLLVLSTGMGKSLCYQLPAYMYSQKRKSITLVVSPLVSLMDDQVSGLPRFLKAACLHSGMSKDQRDKTMNNIEAGKVDILLISPEAITSWAGMSPYTSPFSKLPPISFVCIDECHCLSEWSHSFRPSYLRVCQVLKEQLGIKCLIGLTATCTVSSCGSIAQQLGITDIPDGMIMDTNLPDNLVLSSSRDRYKDEALIELLKCDRFKSLSSIIVYCTRRDEASRLASYLRTSLQNQLETNETFHPPDDFCDSVSTTSSKKRKRSASNKSRKRQVCSWNVDCYHAGMSPAQRRKVQKQFMNEQLRIVVATVAFGMGIDKQDVRAVIHYNMPRSFERYVQEIGRAGRDGLPAHCHTFLDCQGGDISELSRHVYAKTVDRYIVKKLVRKVFKPCKCSLNGKTCRGHVVAVPITAAVEELDMTREGIETLLCYLELDSLMKVFLPTRSVCSIQCYDGPRQMALVAKKCPAVALGLASKGLDSTIQSDLNFSVVEAADELGVDIFTLQRNLRSLMWDTTLSADVISGRSGVNVEFEEVSFLMKSVAESSDDFLDQVTDSLHNRVKEQERKELAQLQTCFDSMRKFSFSDVASSQDKALLDNSNGFKALINKYFTQEEVTIPDYDQLMQIDPQLEKDLRISIQQFLGLYSTDLGGCLTGRTIARIFHGIDSPRYPATTWGTVRRFWRSRLSVNFNAIVKIATDEILKFR